MNDKPKRKPIKHIAPAEFVKAYYKNDRNATRAIKELHQDLTPQSAEVTGSRMLSNVKVQQLLNVVEDKIIQGSVKGINRLNELVESEDERIASDVSKYLVDQAKGKAIQKSEVKVQSVAININLNSGEQPS